VKFGPLLLYIETRFKKRNFGTVTRIREKEGRSKDVNLNSASEGECNRDKEITDVTMLWIDTVTREAQARRRGMCNSEKYLYVK
jgi:hypothetical protein